MRGFGGANVREIVSNFDTDTFRAVYTMEYEGAIYILHCFQKKSKRGSETPKQELDMIHRRLDVAREEHEKWQKQKSMRKTK
jgi:phage-related protein